MKATVLKSFRDKRNGKVYKVGATIEVTKERFEEIRKTDSTLVKATEELEAVEEKTVEKPTEKKKPTKKSKE